MAKITEKMVRDGIQNGDIQFKVDPNMGTGTVCSIGEHWFYFGGLSAEEQSPEEYLENTPVEDVASEIFDVLEDFREDEAFADEYAYYAEILSQEQKFQRAYENYKLQWMLDHGYTLRDLIDELEQAREDCDDDLNTLFDTWESESGFGSEIWPCAEEYRDCEYQMPQSECLTAKTPIGDLVAESGSDPNYPGIWIALHNSDDEELSLALVEYDTEEGLLVTRVWGDADEEDYTSRIVHKNLEKEDS